MTVEDFLKALDDRAHSDAQELKAEQQTAQIVAAVNNLATLLQPPKNTTEEVGDTKS